MLKRSKKILLEGTLAEFKNYPRGAEGREYVLMNIEEKGPDGSYAFYEKDDKGDIIPVSYKGAEGYDAADFTFILFKDPEFKRIILANFNTNPKGGITTKEADAITDIGQLFKGNTALVTTEDLALLKNVKTIPLTAFLGCTSLLTAIIPKQIIDLKSNCFDKCSNLKVVKVYGDAQLTTSSASFGLVDLDSVEFYGTKTTNIGAGSDTDASSVFISNSINTITKNTFANFKSLTEINIPSSVNYIQSNAFQDCTNLTRVNITDLAAWCKINFVDKYSNPVVYAHKLYLNGEEVEDIVIPNDITLTNKYTFSGFTNLKSVLIPNTVTSIGSYTFSDCTALTSIVIPDSVTEIGYLAFSNCTSLTSITIPNSVTNIHGGAFKYCTGITSIELPISIATIEGATFDNCTGLTYIKCYRETPASILYPYYGNPFNGITSTCTLYVPINSLGAYQTADYWKNFQNIVGFDPEEETQE